MVTSICFKRWRKTTGRRWTSCPAGCQLFGILFWWPWTGFSCAYYLCSQWNNSISNESV